ncbi:MAG: protein kinase [Candidatus Calescibacterium sp.]|nr:protein kinase [Candidatus Calescibacterium sp.]MCX7972129.1 protein kinase [bacterium]MDW8194817.1 protein kinase [Candidatus Calescibacterium sp.]
MENLLVGRYRVINKLGQGGMGQVFLAHDTVLDRKVAIKVLTPELTKKQEFLQRFLREARITASLDHINIVKIYDLLFQNQQYYLVMEYIDGESLRNFIEKKLITDSNLLLDIFLQILDGIEYAHSKNIVHRDLKPENIMITKDNIVKITDFGLAFAIGSHSITNPGVLMGTLGYLSPEQAKGIDIDHRTDIYSLGVILYELFTFNLPIVDLNPASMIYKILNEPPTPPSKYNPDIPKQIEKIILKCLQKDKNKRYTSVSEIKKEINYFLESTYQEYQVQIEQEPPQEQNQKNISNILYEISSYKKNLPDLSYDLAKEYSKEKVDLKNYRETQKTHDKYILGDLGIAPEKISTLSPRDIESMLSTAQKYYEQKNYEETIKILEILLPYYKNKTILYVLAKSHYKLGNLQKALHYVELHKKDYGENEKILAIEGDILYSLQDYVNSYISFYKVYELTGEKSYIILACKAALNYDPNLAVDLLSNIISVETDQHILAKSYKYLGLAYYRLGNYELAIRNLEYYLKTYDDPSVMGPLIKSYKMVGKSLELARIYSALLESTDDENILKDALGFYISTSKYKEAIEVCYRLISINPDDLSVYQDLYLASKSIHNTTSLILSIENILRLHQGLSNESKAELLEELALLYEEEFQYWDAIKVVNQLIELKGVNISYKYRLADLYSKVGNYEYALNIMYELVSIDSSNPILYEKISDIYHRMGDIEQSIQSIKTAIEFDPSNYYYYKKLSNLYLESNKTDELIKILNDLIDYNPDELEAYILLANVYLSLKNYQEAYEYIIIVHSKASKLNVEIPLKCVDILLYSLYGIFKGIDLINKFKEIVFEIKNPNYLPYVYYSIAFLYWLSGYEINSIEYLNNSIMISKNSDRYIYILSNSLVNFIKGKQKEAIKNLEDSQKLFRECNVKEIKKRYFELLITMYLLINTIPPNLDSYFSTLADLYEKYEAYGLFLKGMFIERIARDIKTDYSNALHMYEKAINQGFENEYILFRAFFLNLVLSNYSQAKQYINKLISINPKDSIYQYYYKVCNK